MHAQHRSTSESSICVSELGTVVLLLSELRFTTATLTHTLGSSVPFLLMHLPPPPPISSDSGVENMLREVGSTFWNPAVCGVQGLLCGELDVRWERDPGGSGQPGLWCRDKECRTGRCIHLGSMSMSFRTLIVNSDGYPSLDDSTRG
ncbi:hypothetical protein DFJ58DRAFT_103023 [Suillus subalutaceus]|uniref:uncharacterized protein n=1 Tax=Suillus subalutaceus TaxID=48586 RepID=UPI001B8850C3|nr:uncharacterized protein DFJ58DRAFT_103023 [Suillus subalutaceus]KAG1839755.1 hypothetical protein DFJ58DRAFT_103023 [Suillus subalutaceus]